MNTLFLNSSTGRRVALLAVAGVLASLAFASVASAASPPGTACVSSDGKISARGATFQTLAQQNAFIPGYTFDVCGVVSSQGANDPSPTGMVAYNYPASTGGGGGTGSGQGQKAVSCRSDAFGGSDKPYDKATLASLKGAAGALGGCSPLGTGGFLPPYTPNVAPFPDAGDASNVNMMSFPVAGSSVAIGVNLSVAQDGAGCDASNLQWQVSDLSKIYGGLVTNWNQLPGLAGCDKPITRIVRLDSSGTTQTFKNGLARADGATALCDGNTWSAFTPDAANTNWPTTGACPANLVRPGVNGGQALVQLVSTTDASIGYADLADWLNFASTVPLATLRNQANTAFQGPANGQAANCQWTGAVLPGIAKTNADAVGLNANADQTWAFDSTANGGRGYANVTFTGTTYPLCGFTWDMVYTGLSAASPGGAVSRLTNDQRATLWSYFTYLMSPAAQARLGAPATTPGGGQPGYVAIPTAWLRQIRLGFQAAF